MRCVHLLVKGKVQGVFFRASTKEIADKLNIKGTVRNTTAGDVEIIASGSDKEIESFIEWCRRGPSRARVEQIIIDELPEQHLTSFQIIK